tara:strand:+ start:2040 stop:2282 length:243 start_codon:yes stop_codon:yes gene_type:complete
LKIKHSKKRKKFQKHFVKVIVDHLPIYKILHLCREKFDKEFKKLSDKEFIKTLENKMLGDHCVDQYIEFQEFRNYVEGKK